jgi:hypothetical protein
MNPALALALVTSAATSGAPLTEAEVVALALRNSPQVKAQAHFLDEASAETEAN